MSFDDTCTICREDVIWASDEKNGIVLKCNHAFHVECIFQYAIDEHKCPNCRCELRTKTEQPRLLYQERIMILTPLVSTRRVCVLICVLMVIVMIISTATENALLGA